MKFHNLRDLYLYELRDLFSSANQLVDVLPKLTEATAADALRDAFTKHLDEAQGQIARVHAIFETLGERSEGGFSEGMHGSIQEATEWAGENADSEVLDAGLIAALQRLLHYEIAALGCTRTHAKVLGEASAQKLLQDCLDEAEAADKRLTGLAETINKVAKNAD